MSEELKLKYEDIMAIDPKVETDDMARKMVKSMLKGATPYEVSKTAVAGTKKSPETVYQKARRLYELIMKASGESLDDLLDQFKSGEPVYIPMLRVQKFKAMLVKEHLVHVNIEKMQKFTLLDDPKNPGPITEPGETPFESETPGGPVETPAETDEVTPEKPKKTPAKKKAPAKKK